MDKQSILKPTRSDIVITILCFIILFFSFYLLLWSDSLHTYNEKQVGKVSFKYRVAQRKYVSRMIWEDVEQNTPVYNNDTIRTDQLSEATITLFDNTKIELDPDSMFVLNVVNNKIKLNVIKGSVLVDRENNKKISNIQIEQNKSSISLKSGKFRVNQSKNKVKIVSHSGDIDIQKGNKKFTLKDGQVAIVDSNGFKNFNLKYHLIKPKDNIRIFTKNKSDTVNFQWKSNNSKVLFQIAKDRKFQEKVFLKIVNANQIEVNLKEGVYFWRITKPNHSRLQDKSVTRKIHIIQNEKVKLISPSNEKQIPYQRNEISILFTWKKLNLSSDYTIQIAKDRKFNNLIYNESIYKNFVTYKFGEGTYFWKIIAKGSIKGSRSQSDVYQFHVIKKDELLSRKVVEEEVKVDIDKEKELQKKKKNIKRKLEKEEVIELVFPKNESIIDMTDMDFLPIRWKNTNRYGVYNIKLYENNTKEKKLVFQKEIRNNEYKFKDLSKLDEGDFFVIVENEKKVMDSARFKIKLSEKLEVPKVIQKIRKNISED